MFGDAPDWLKRLAAAASAATNAAIADVPHPSQPAAQTTPAGGGARGGGADYMTYLPWVAGGIGVIVLLKMMKKGRH